jgi:hypothetical protein
MGVHSSQQSCDRRVWPDPGHKMRDLRLPRVQHPLDTPPHVVSHTLLQQLGEYTSMQCGSTLAESMASGK